MKLKHNRGFVHHKSKIKHEKGKEETPLNEKMLSLRSSSQNPWLFFDLEDSILFYGPKVKNKRGETLRRVFSPKRSDLQSQRVDLVLSRSSPNPRPCPLFYRSSKTADMGCTCCWAYFASLRRTHSVAFFNSSSSSR